MNNEDKNVIGIQRQEEREYVNKEGGKENDRCREEHANDQEEERLTSEGESVDKTTKGRRTKRAMRRLGSGR